MLVSEECLVFAQELVTLCASWRGRIEEVEIAGALQMLAARVAFDDLGKDVGRKAHLKLAIEAFDGMVRIDEALEAAGMLKGEPS